MTKFFDLNTDDNLDFQSELNDRKQLSSVMPFSKSKIEMLMPILAREMLTQIAGGFSEKTKNYLASYTQAELIVEIIGLTPFVNRFMEHLSTEEGHAPGESQFDYFHTDKSIQLIFWIGSILGEIE